jgi:hypothetical protein
MMMYCDALSSIDVYEDPDCSTPIGTARCIGWDAAGSAVWRLLIPDGDPEGPCVLVDREFLSIGPRWHDLYHGDAHAGIGRPRGPRWTQAGVQPPAP